LTASLFIDINEVGKGGEEMRRILLVLVGTAIIAAMLAFGSAGSAFGQVTLENSGPDTATEHAPVLSEFGVTETAPFVTGAETAQDATELGFSKAG
jgi:hypothetical protein